MDGSAPKKVVQYTDQQDQKFHEGVAAKVSEATGSPVAPADVKPDNNAPLQNLHELFGDTAHVVGSAVEEGIHGASSTTHDRSSLGSKGASFMRDRMNKLFFSKRNSHHMKKVA